MDNKIIIERRRGDITDPYVLLNEIHIVDDSIVTLSEIPDDFYRVIVTGDNKTWSEIVRGIPNHDEFIVDYANRIVTFSQSNNGKQLNFEFQGTGMKYFPPSTIFTKVSDGKVTETLDQVIEKGYEAIQNIADVRGVINDAQTAADNANLAATNVNTKITEVDNKLIEIDTTITNKLTEIDGDTDTLINGKLTDIETRYTNQEAIWQTDINAKLSNIDSKATLADTKISELQTKINSADTEIADKIAEIDLEGTTAINNKVGSLDGVFNQNISNWDSEVESKIAEVDSKQVTWQANEDNRNIAEIARETAETTRETNESTRIEQENLRLSAEANRADNENIRVSNENLRQSNESDRESAELNRQQQEVDRQTNTTTAINNADQAATNANIATEQTNTAISNAQSMVNNTKYIEEYNPTTLYKKNNIVTYNGSSFIAKQDTQGNIPIGSIADAYFGLLSQRGLDGSGSVVSVNGISPDLNGLVNLTSSDIGAYSKIETDNKIAEIVDSAPETLNTLNELSKALGDDPNFATTISSQIGNKVDKVIGKQLSTEDFTTTEKNKLSGIETGANKYIHPDTHSAAMIIEDPTRRFITDDELSKLQGIEDGANNYTHPSNHPASIITQDSVHRMVSDSQINNWNAKETVEGSQLKANTARDEAKSYTDSEIESLTASNVGAISISEKGVANGVAELDVNSKVPLSQLPDISKQQTYVVSDSATRNSLVNLISGDRAYETTTGDSYIWDGFQWLLQADADWENVSLEWTNINGKPTDYPPESHTHAELHTHANKSLLDQLTDDAGQLQYNGQPIGTVVENLTETELTLGNFKLVFNSTTNSLDIVVI